MKITLKKQVISYKESTKFLGMTLDSRLNWEEHVDRVRAKAKIALNTIKVVAGSRQKRRRGHKHCIVQYSDLRWIMVANCTVYPPHGD